MSKDAQNQAASILSKEALLIWTQLGETPLHIDQIAEKSALPVSQISAQLLLLELQGWIASYPGMNFSRRLPPSASA